MANNSIEAKEVRYICEEIKKMFDVEQIIVFGIKRSEKDNTVTDLDVCVVASTDDKNAWLRKAYLEIDSEIPFDIFLYTPSEWNGLIKQSESFASRIVRKGCVFFGKA